MTSFTRTDSGVLEFTTSPEQQQYFCDLINRSLRRDGAAPVCKKGRLCKGRCIPKNHKCSEGGSLSSSQEDGKKFYDNPSNISAAYEHIGGDDYARELTQSNKKMSSRHAQSYVREAARSHLMAMEDHDAGNRELQRVNEKYAPHFGN